MKKPDRSLIAAGLVVGGFIMWVATAVLPVLLAFGVWLLMFALVGFGGWFGRSDG